MSESRTNHGGTAGSVSLVLLLTFFLTACTHDNYLIVPSTTSATIGTPTISLGAGAGGTATANITGNDLRFNISVTTGTLPALSSTALTITFNITRASPVICTKDASNNNAAALTGVNMVYIDQAAATNNSIQLKTGTTALGAATTYTWNFGCPQ